MIFYRQTSCQKEKQVKRTINFFNIVLNKADQLLNKKEPD